MDMTSNTSNSSAAASAPHNHQQEAVVSSPARAVVSSPKPRPRPRQQEPALSCPRCFSDNTKFCYYNNYKLDQPRYFCKECRRYWTQGGSLRVVPVGGSSRRNKRASGSTSSSAASSTATTSAEMERTFKTRLAAGGSDTGFLSFGPLSLLSEALELELAPGRSETTPILLDILAEGYSDAGGSSSSNYASLAINSGINGKEDMPFLLPASASYPMETMQLVEGMEDVAGELQWQSYINDDGGYAAAPAAGVEQQQQVPGDQQPGDNNKTKDSSNRGINNSNNRDGAEW